MKHVILAVALLISGCSQLEYGFALDSDHFMYRNNAAKVDALTREEFRLHLANVIDTRPADEVRIEPTGFDKIYEYDPNKFLQGLTYYVDSSMGGRIRRLSNGTIDLYVDLEIEKFRTWISTGSFLSGAYGRYNVETVMNMVVRDAASNVLFTQEISYDETDARKAYQGHHPTAKMDEKKMRDMIKDAIRSLTKDVGWYTHRAFNNQRKYYHPEAFEREFETYAETNDIPAS